MRSHLRERGYCQKRNFNWAQTKDLMLHQPRGRNKSMISCPKNCVPGDMTLFIKQGTLIILKKKQKMCRGKISVCVRGEAWPAYFSVNMFE